MSEALAGMLPAAPAAVPRDAAVAIVFRRTATGIEVFWTRRELALRFAGGFVAFPGGRFEVQDQEISVLHAQGADARLRGTAARELFEETGMPLLHPPTLHALEVLSRFTSPLEAAARIAAPPDCEDFVGKRIEFQRGICLVPLRTPTLPPATHTNCYVIGNEELLIVDPGSEEDSELKALFELIEHRRA